MIKIHSKVFGSLLGSIRFFWVLGPAGGRLSHQLNQMVQVHSKVFDPTGLIRLDPAKSTKKLKNHQNRGFEESLLNACFEDRKVIKNVISEASCLKSRKCQKNVVFFKTFY